MNTSSVLDAVYLPVKGRREPARFKRHRTSKLDVHSQAIQNWLLLRAESKNKLMFSQRLFIAKLKREQGLNVSQAALSRFCKTKGWEGFFNE
jgi:hypothetical protein